MIQAPPTVLVSFEACLAAKNISENLRGYYKKWLRFYLDFCLKYHHDSNKSDSLTKFQKKLQEKGQSERQRQQAADAVRLYLNINQASTFSKFSSGFPVSALTHVERSNTKLPVKFSTTMIYTHTGKNVTIKEAKSPLDF